MIDDRSSSNSNARLPQVLSTIQLAYICLLTLTASHVLTLPALGTTILLDRCLRGLLFSLILYYHCGIYKYMVYMYMYNKTMTCKEQLHNQHPSYTLLQAVQGYTSRFAPAVPVIYH